MPTVAPLDPLAPLAAPGRYEDDRVVVARAPTLRPVDVGPVPGRVHTPHFDLVPAGARLHVTHAVPPEAVDDGLAGLVVDELFHPGWVRGADLAERIVTGVVRSVADPADPLAGWEGYYRRTLERLARPAPLTGAASGTAAGLAGTAAVHARALALTGPGPALVLGCGFGFLALRLAAAGRAVTAVDGCPGTVRLLSRVAPRLGVPLTVRLADPARLPLEDRCADTVLVVDLLQRLDAAQAATVVVEARRCARRRVVVAVPLEPEADEAHGHLRTVGPAELRALGEACGAPYGVVEGDGGWLVVDVAE